MSLSDYDDDVVEDDEKRRRLKNYSERDADLRSDWCKLQERSCPHRYNMQSNDCVECRGLTERDALDYITEQIGKLKKLIAGGGT
ncbi:MAG: hypothetical protein ABSC64_02300 [Candidatus Korobacteraceae bacterium]|jgi:hypothetical protein